MGLSSVLNPDTVTLEFEEEASEGEMEVDSADPRIGAGTLGERFLRRASPALLLFQESGVSNFWPPKLFSALPSWLDLLGLELVSAARASL